MLPVPFASAGVAVRRTPVALMLLLGTIMAGCISGGTDLPAETGPETPTVDLDAFVNPLIQDHDHTDPAHHHLGWNMERTGGSLLDSGIRGHAAPHALDVQADKLFVSAYTALGQEAGVWIFDLAADPADPPLLGKALIPGPGGGDRNMEATADGNFVVLGVEDQDCAGNVQQPGSWGMYLFDTSDPKHPVQVDRVEAMSAPVGGLPSFGQHSITVVSTDDGDFVYHGGGNNVLYEIDRDTKRFVEVGEFRARHDAAVFHDPVEDRLLLLSADVSELKVYDLTDPRKPEIVGGWKPEALGSYYIHTAVADHIDGRNIAIVNSEDFKDDPSTFWVLDITDLNAVKVLAQWFSPDDVPSGDLTFSLHNPRIQNGTLTFSYYHGGVWQFDLNDPDRLVDPKPRAYYLPHGPVGRAAEPDGETVMAKVCGTLLQQEDNSLDILMDAVPFTFDVELYGEYVYAADVNTGVHALRFEPGAAGSHSAEDH